MLSKQVIFVLLAICLAPLRSAAIACNAPLLSGVEKVTTSSFTLQWTDFNAGDVSWEIEYVTHGETPTGSPNIIEISDNAVEINALSSGTAYDIYIRTICVDGEKSEWNGPFTFRTAIENDGSCQLNLAIEDNNCPMGEDFLIHVDGFDNRLLGRDVFIQSVEVQMVHDWPADLSLQLVHPEGIAIDLFNHGGIGKDNLGDVSDTLCTNPLVFSDFSCDDLATLNSEQVVGTFLPEQNISDLYKEQPINGLWRLRVCDRAQEDIGILEHVKINFSTLLCNAPIEIAAINIDVDKVDIRWTPDVDCDVAIINVVNAGDPPGSGIEIFTACQAGIFNVDQLEPNTSYDIYIKSDCGSSTSTFSCPVTFTTACTSVSHALSFDDVSPCENTCLSSCPIEDQLWSNLSSDQADWIVNNGSTPTDQTGPSGDIISIGNYAYLENGVDLCGSAETAILETKCLFIEGNEDGCDFSFYYHMYGADVNLLTVEVSIDDGENWIEIWRMSGDQGDQWHRAFIDLQDFAGLYAKVRFRGITGVGDRADLAIDQLEFYGSNVATVLPVFYFDRDRDGYGTPDSVVSFCLNTPPVSFSRNDLDCQDDISAINPGVIESPCNAIDDNCDGLVDEVEENPISVELVEKIDETCPGAGDGGLSIFVSGGQPPYQIVWNNGLSGLNINGLEEGVFFAEIEDALGCKSRSDFYEIDRLNTPTIFYSNIRNTRCGQSVGIIDIEMTGGTPPYSFLWSSGEETEDLINIPEGTYAVTVTDNIGCQVMSDNIEIIASPRFTAGVQFKRELRCFGDSNGIISIGVINAVPPVKFDWSNGDTTATIDELSAGEYQVTISDARGCDEVITTSIAVPDPLNTTVNAIEQVSCHNETNGSIRVSTTGGKAPFNFRWVDSAGLEFPGNATEDLLNIPAGEYQLFVRDANGCETTTEMIAIPNPPPINISVEEQKPVPCRLSQDGKLSVQASGGNGEYEYFWSNGMKGNELDSLKAGKYSIRVIDRLGCKAASNDLEVEILNIPIEVSLALINNNFCAFDSSGIIAAEITSPVSLPLDYNWNNGRQTQKKELSDTIMSLPAGRYTVTVTDALGCTGSQVPLEITSPDELLLSEITIQSTTCQNAADGSIDISVSGGIPPYNYLWNTGDTTRSLEDIPAGEYTIQVIDQNDCMLISQPIIVANTNPIIIDAEITPTTDTLDDGAIHLQISGGSPPYMLNWQHSVDTSASINNLSPGEYCVSVTDDNNCIVSECYEISNSTSTDDYSKNSIDIFPNPFIDWVRVESKNKIEKLIIYTTNGKEVIRKNNVINAIIPMENINSGVYYIVLIINNSAHTYKVIKI